VRVQIFLAAGFAVAALALVLLVLRLFLHKVRPGQALVVSGSRRRVVFTRTIVLPIIERAEAIDVSTRTLVIDPEPPELLVTKDNQRLTYRATFYVGVNRTREDVLRVADALGCARASDPAAVDALFRPKLVSGLRLAAHEMTYKELQDGRERLQDEVLMVIGQDLNGFVLQDLVIDRIEPADPGSAGPFR
jgi:uncharacterized membrane protein YqiK